MLELKFKTFDEEREIKFSQDDVIKILPGWGRYIPERIIKNYFYDLTDSKKTKTLYSLIEDHKGNIYMFDLHNHKEPHVIQYLGSFSKKNQTSVFIQRAIQRRELIFLTKENINNFRLLLGPRYYDDFHENYEEKYNIYLGTSYGSGRFIREIRLFKQIMKEHNIPFVIYRLQRGRTGKNITSSFWAVFKTEEFYLADLIDILWKKYDILKKDFETKTGYFSYLQRRG